MREQSVRVYGEILKVNQQYEYVVARCLVMPWVGTRLNVVRGTNSVGRVQVTPQRRASYITADILSGHPRPGDVLLPENMKP